MACPAIFAARPLGRAKADCVGIRPPLARQLMAAAPMSERLWIFMGRFADMVAFMDIYGY
jgi:hypothetical protein